MPPTVEETTTVDERPAILFIKGSLIGYQQKVQDKFDLFSEASVNALFYYPDATVTTLPTAQSTFYTEMGENRDDGSIYLIEIGDPDRLNPIYDDEQTEVLAQIAGGIYIENYEPDNLVAPRQYQLPVALTHVRYIEITTTTTFDPDNPVKAVEKDIDPSGATGGTTIYYTDEFHQNYVKVVYGSTSYSIFEGNSEAEIRVYDLDYEQVVNDIVKKQMNDTNNGVTDEDEDPETVFVVRGYWWIFEDYPDDFDPDNPPTETSSRVIIGLGLWKKEED